MQILRSLQELRSWTETTRTTQSNSQATIGLVPTMGALHAGHISLLRAALAECSAVLVTIFVNPTQFGPNEDFDRYPRTFAADCALLENELAASTSKNPAVAAPNLAVFAPSVEELYPSGAKTFVEVEDLSSRLDGLSRPGHFRGVATIVAKLLIAAQSDRAYFGQKDAAQCAVIRRLVTDLLIPTKIVICPIVREADGLAMSSRNAYLTTHERQQAIVLSRALRAIEEKFSAGERSIESLKQLAQQIFAAEPQVRLDYIEIVDWQTLQPEKSAETGSLCAIAAYIGKTRLIDNTILSVDNDSRLKK